MRQRPGRADLARLTRRREDNGMEAHDVRTAFDGLDEVEFRSLAKFNKGEVGVFWAGSGTSPWERHPDDDELLQVLEGEVVIRVLTDDGPVDTTVGAGSV